MSSERERQRLEDIVANIEMIERYIANFPFDAFLADDKTVNATERCLQRITEAVIKIGPERMATIAPDVPMQAVRGLGNMLRHEYDNIDLRTIYNTAVHDLPMLKEACDQALKKNAL